MKHGDIGASTSPVNFRSCPVAHPGKHRLPHIHRNVPGALAEINKVVSDNRITIASEYLLTNEASG